MCAWPSGLSSLHDRACEIFAQIKGGIVDYGEEHSAEFGHERYGRAYEGLFPEWSAEHPVHLVGHSLGGVTIRVLQHLLDTRAFPGHNTSAAWITSITVINAPLNGSIAAYALGEKEKDAPAVVKLSPGHMLGCAVHLLAFLDVRLGGFDLGLDHWNLSAWKGPITAITTLRDSLLVRSTIVESKDNAAFDASVHSMSEWNKSIRTHPNCYYFSWVGTGVEANAIPAFPQSAVLKNVLFWIVVLLQWAFRRAFLSTIAWLSARREYPDLKPFEGFDLAAYKVQSDGLCSEQSQRYPVSKSNPQRAAPLPKNGQPLTPGVWYYSEHGQDHMGVVPFPPSDDYQRSFFRGVFLGLASLPLADESKEEESNDMQLTGVDCLGLSAEVRGIHVTRCNTSIHVPVEVHK
jgi:hypothetical protein